MAELVDEPFLVEQVARIAAQLEQPLARQVIDLASACFDAGVAHGIVSKVLPSPGLLESMLRIRGVVSVSRVWVDGKPSGQMPEEPFR